jgi:chromosome partitioning protein
MIAMPKARVISILNYKGGVGKTTSAFHIGCSLAQHHNKKVLLIDIDPQTNLTFLCADYNRWMKFKTDRGTIGTLFKQFTAHGPLDPRQVIWKSPINLSINQVIKGLDLMPCDVDLLGDDLGLDGTVTPFPMRQPSAWAMEEFLRSRRFLMEVVKKVEKDYDFILIDCPPNLYLLTQNALLASEAYLVTAIPDYLSRIGIRILGDKIRQISGKLEAAQLFLGKEYGLDSVARMGGIVFAKVRATILAENIMTEVRAEYRDICFGQHTSDLVGYSEAAERLLPVWECKTPNAQRAAGEKQYEKITEIFLNRFQTHGNVKKAASIRN